MEVLQLSIRYGRLVSKADNSFKGYIFKQDNGYFEGVVLDLVSSDSSSFIFGIINDDVYNIYQIFNRQGADYINYNAQTPYWREQKRGYAYSSKDGKTTLKGHCFVSKYPIRQLFDLSELENQINTCKNNMSIYDRKTYESISSKLIPTTSHIKQKTL